MQENLVRKLGNTLLVILKAREEVTAVAVVGTALAWEVVPNERPYGDPLVWWGARIYLPAEAYAQIPAKDRHRVEQVTCRTLQEIARPIGHHFAWVNLAPKLVEQLTDSQADLVRWARETWPREIDRLNTATESIPDAPSWLRTPEK